MKRIVIAAAMGLCVVSLAAVSSADTLDHERWRARQGTVMGYRARTITFRHADGVSRRYTTSEVEALEFFSAERANPRAVSGQSSRRRPGPSSSCARWKRSTRETPAPDQAFSAIVEQDVTDASGRVIVPEGSSAQLMIRQMSTGGATGSPEMVLDVQAITIGGRRYLVSTADVTLESGTGVGKNKRTAEAVGGGAALGTIIGAIAGGGKGAAIGVLVGAAGGAGAQVLTRGTRCPRPRGNAAHVQTGQASDAGAGRVTP